jgi:hypothetical protein
VIRDLLPDLGSESVLIAAAVLLAAGFGLLGFVVRDLGTRR